MATGLKAIDNKRTVGFTVGEESFSVEPFIMWESPKTDFVERAVHG